LLAAGVECARVAMSSVVMIQIKVPQMLVVQICGG
jgi:hypothetical protein